MSEETRRAINRIIPSGPAAAGTMTPEQAAELSSVLIPKLPNFNVAAAVGLPRNANPYVITLQQSFTLALINARIYQLQLENLYSAALAVALQRFQFEPQFYAGMSPLTSPTWPRWQQRRFPPREPAQSDQSVLVSNAVGAWRPDLVLDPGRGRGRG